MESQESDSLASSGVRSGLVASLVCVASAALFVAFGLAYRNRKDSLPKGEREGANEIDGEYQESECLSVDPRQTAALLSETEVTCTPGFDSTMIYAAEGLHEEINESPESCDPLHLCIDSRESRLVSPEKTLFSQPLFAQQRRRNMPAVRDETGETTPRASFSGWWEQSAVDEDAVMAQAVIVGEVNRARSSFQCGEEDDDTRLLAQTESEDEDVPMRVVDLIRFYTPQRHLEPPGNIRRR
jgi:hypothetical protein